jgi:transposase InsO family protein
MIVSGWVHRRQLTKYTSSSESWWRRVGTEVIRLPPLSPNLNAYAERFVRSIKDECLEKMIFVGQASLRRGIGEYMAHYHEERNHQGLGNGLIRPEPMRATNAALIRRRPRLGGMVNYYYRAAA